MAGQFTGKVACACLCGDGRTHLGLNGGLDIGSSGVLSGGWDNQRQCNTRDQQHDQATSTSEGNTLKRKTTGGGRGTDILQFPFLKAARSMRCCSSVPP
jgi:hypothetical protein